MFSNDDKTFKAEVEKRLANGESLRSIAKALDVSYQTLQYHRRRWGLPTLRDGAVSGSDHHSYRGGEFVDRWGYKMIRSPERDACNPYTPEHILVAEKMIGRRIKRNVEVVHHINGDKMDNRPDNLLVCTRSEHREFHGQIESIGYQLIRRGLIVFEDGEYKLAE